MAENKLDKIMGDLIYEANTLCAVRVVIRTLADNVDLINQYVEYSTFFAVVEETCLQCLFLSTGKIFDQYDHKETSSLKSLKRALLQGRGVDIDKDKADELIVLVDDFLRDHENAGILDRIKEIRHQFIAHKQTEAEQNAQDITMNELYGLIDKTFIVLNQVADRIGFHGNKRIIKGDTVKSSILSVLDTLFPGGNPSHNTS